MTRTLIRYTLSVYNPFIIRSEHQFQTLVKISYAIKVLYVANRAVDRGDPSGFPVLKVFQPFQIFGVFPKWYHNEASLNRQNVEPTKITMKRTLTFVVVQNEFQVKMISN